MSALMSANTVIICLDHSIKIIPIYKMDSHGFLELVIDGLYTFREQSLQQRQLLVGWHKSMIIDAEKG